MFAFEHHLTTRYCKLGFLVDLREEHEAAIRADRGIGEKRLPKSVTVDEGPFSFTLSHRLDDKDDERFSLELSVERRLISGDKSLDCEQALSGFEYMPVFNGGEPEGNTRVVRNAWPNAAEKLPPGREGRVDIVADCHWDVLETLYGEEEPLVARMRLGFTMNAGYEVPTFALGRNIAAAHPLDSLASFVSLPHPNNVAFILASSPLRPLYSNKAILSAASPYFSNYFNPTPVGRRGSRAPVKKSISFADDSDADSDDEEDEDLELLVAPDQLGSQRSKRKSPDPTSTEDEETEAEAPVRTSRSPEKAKRKKGNGSVSPPDTKDFRTEAPVVEIHVDDGSYSTMQAILVYLLCKQIEFAPLSTLEGRDEYIREYRKKYPDRPVPVSPRSVYRLATRFELPALQELALAHLKYSLTLETAVQEALGDDCYHFPSYCEVVHNFVADEWEEVKESEAWEDVLKRAENGKFTHSGSLLPKLLLAIM
ncbi:hypothetical protein JCM16303_004276 [Sporobolomyces ruberrimus]